MASEVQHKGNKTRYQELSRPRCALTDALLSLDPLSFRGELRKQALINKIMLSQEITGSF